MLKKGATALTLIGYTILGLIGLPVFSSGGGLSYVLTPSFGYLLGFIVGAVLLSAIYSSPKIKKRIVAYILGCLVCIVSIYTLGITYLYIIMNVYMDSAISVSSALVKGALIFLPFDVVKCVIAYLIIITLEKATGKSQRPSFN